MQRRRLLTATLELVYERGAQGVTVALVSDRAGVSRKTFYDIFADREGCLLAAFEEAAQRATQAVEQAVEGHRTWRDEIRSGLTGLLSFLEDEPVTGRVVIVEALSSGEQALEARRRLLAQTIVIVDRGRTEPDAVKDVPPLTAEGVVGAVFSVIHARMLTRPQTGERDARPLTDLVGPLMVMILQPYLGSLTARKELERQVLVPERAKPKLPADPFKDLPIRLTYRTAQVLSSIATTPGASSKQIATASGVADEGQMSRLLTRLERVELIRNAGMGPTKGEANAWSLTEKGHNVHAVIAQQTGGSKISRRGA
jgi:AcrR family transcriptional regulator/DNA-binding MarR family transcriptional regulator